MAIVLAGSILFIVTHFGLSSTPLRAVLVRAMGDKGFMIFYSLVSLATFGVMVYGYVVYQADVYYWTYGMVQSAIARTLMLLSLLLLVMGLMKQSPISMMPKAGADWQASGVLKITRHPVMWAMLLWGLSHLLVNGDPGSIVLFGTFVLVAGMGTVLMDNRHKASGQPHIGAVFSQTSNVPFLAILTGKTSFGQADLDWKALLTGVVVYCGVYLAHEWISGVALY